MITSMFKKIHPATGIISILINTEDIWVHYCIDKAVNSSELIIEFSWDQDVEYMPGCWDEETVKQKEVIKMPDDFNPFKYMLYDFQNKDQIGLMLIPKDLLRDKTQWEDYGIQSQDKG